MCADVKYCGSLLTLGKKMGEDSSLEKKVAPLPQPVVSEEFCDLKHITLFDPWPKASNHRKAKVGIEQSEVRNILGQRH